MERGGSSNQWQNHSTRTHRAGIFIQEGHRTTAADNSIHPEQTFKRDAEQYMPIANVTRIMRRVLPENAKIADDAKETIQECVSEFISFITGKANERCHREYRKTITPDDVLSAMESLGLDNYIETLSVYLEKHRAQDPEREPVNNRAPYARRMAHRPTAPIVPEWQTSPPAPPASYYIPKMVPRTSTTYAVDSRGGYAGLPPYFMGGGEGSSSEAEFDPFGQHFK